MEQSKLPALSYASILEALGERFHASPALLQALNPEATFAAGEQIEVPNVGARRCRRRRGDRRPVRSRRDRPGRRRQGDRALPGDDGQRARSAADRRVEDQRRRPQPVVHYNPDLFWDADAALEGDDCARARTIRSAWCGSISRRSTTASTARREPETIGKTQSHGCIRLTNWDARELAEAVKPGMPAVLQEYRDRPPRRRSRSACSWASAGRIRAIRACGPAPATRSLYSTPRRAMRAVRGATPRLPDRPATARPPERLPSPRRSRPPPQDGAPRLRRRRRRPARPSSRRCADGALAMPIGGIDRRTLRDSFAEIHAATGTRRSTSWRRAARRFSPSTTADREAVHEHAGRNHHLPVRPERALLLLLRASRPLRRRPRGRPEREARPRDRLRRRRPATRRRRRRTCTSRSSSWPRTSAGGKGAPINPFPLWAAS